MRGTVLATILCASTLLVVPAYASDGLGERQALREAVRGQARPAGADGVVPLPLPEPSRPEPVAIVGTPSWHEEQERRRVIDHREHRVRELLRAGIVLRTAGMAIAEPGEAAIAVALAGGMLEIAAVLIFAGQMGTTFGRSMARLEPYIAFIFTAVFWFVAMSVFSVWHTYATMSAATSDELVRLVSTYQAPLREREQPIDVAGNKASIFTRPPEFSDY